DLPVHHAVERHAAGEAEVALARRPLEHAGQVEADLLGHRLERGGDVLVPALERALGQARRPEGVDALLAGPPARGPRGVAARAKGESMSAEAAWARWCST